MSDTDRDTTYVGQVKWFNHKAGYGFITLIGDTLGLELNDEDIFVHHTALQTKENNYKYLTEGEYVWFKKESTKKNDHKYQASNVIGCFNKQLLCEVRQNNRNNNDEWKTVKDKSSSN